MLELSGSDIARLTDAQLRELIVQLSRAELRRQGLPLSGVTAGGHQDAPDGGIDVRVEVPKLLQPDFVPCALTGFQAKATDMSAAAIAAEMRPAPSHELRPSIRGILETGGAYVIVSSRGSVSDIALKDRRDAMKRCLVGTNASDAAVVDFYDRGRLAIWANEHPGVALWLREQIGESLSGWRPFGNWSRSPVASEYLTDDTGRVIARTSGTTEAMDAELGIKAIRAALGRPGGVVRLVGLSGVGKTRLAQALFDESVTEGALDPSIVMYADQGRSPDPTPRDLLFRLAARELRAIVVVDNCNPTLHRELVEIVRDNSDSLSLLTIEYDVTSDEPEETDVFELAPSSPVVLERILERLAPHVTQVDRRTIAEIAGGNARIALSLARTLKTGETLGILSDVEIFKRLFLQHNDEDTSLLRAARALSLVYSFDGVSLEGIDAELSILGDLAGMSSQELYCHVDELVRRDLVQLRSTWRAVLPHALANKMAVEALSAIPVPTILEKLLPHPRLLRSFSRRLNFLNVSPQACKIAEGWLSPGGLLAAPGSFSELQVELFENIAPLAPAAALTSLERASVDNDGSSFLSISRSVRSRWVSVCRSLAYEVEQFDRAAKLLLQFAAVHQDERGAVDAWKELFYIVLSGTMAPVEQRAALVREVLDDSDEKIRKLGIAAAGAMLESAHFSSSHDFRFGARPRGYGWEPDGAGQVTKWYRAAFALVQEFVGRGAPYKGQLLEALSQHFRSLWSNLPDTEELAGLVRRLSGENCWPEAWIAVRSTLKYDTPGLGPERLEALQRLESDLRPTTLLQNIRTYVLTRRHGVADISEAEAEEVDESGLDDYGRVERKAELLGIEIAAQPDLLAPILPDLMSREIGQQTVFGKGLGSACRDVSALWRVLETAFACVPEAERGVGLLCGFLWGARECNPLVVGELLDEAVEHATLASYFPDLQACALDEMAPARLNRSLDLGRAELFRYAAPLSRSDSGLPAEAFAQISLRLLGLEGGLLMVVSVLWQRLHVLRASKLKPPEPFVNLAKKIFADIRFESLHQRLDHSLAWIAMDCLASSDAETAAKELCEKFATAATDYRSGARGFEQLARTLVKLHPAAMLDAFESKPDDGLGRPLLKTFSTRQRSVMKDVDPDAVIRWINVDPSARGPYVARVVPIVNANADGKCEWTALAERLLAMTPDRSALLAAFSTHFHPSSWSGALVDVLQPFLDFASSLSKSDDPVISEWATEQVHQMKARIKNDPPLWRPTDESFE